MNADRFADVERISLAALDLPAAERRAYLDEACAGDAALRAEVEALVAGASRVSGFLERPIAAAAPGAAARQWRGPAEAGHEDAMIGSDLGPYRVLEKLGEGGMGAVYKARDTRLGRTVAIKVLPPGFSADRERRARFEREARTIAALNHPHICVLHDVGRAGDRDYLVMEYIDGPSLADRLRQGPLPLGQAVELAAGIADALSAAHRQGIVHRDLKPANVMLTRSGARVQAKLLDFGLAKLGPSGAVARSALSTREPTTACGAVLGTVPYMAPEQLEGKDADSRADLFAFGCVLYEMITGRRAFAGEGEAAVISAIMTSQPPPVSSLQPSASPALERLVRGCLAKDPDARRESAHDLAEELRALAGRSDAPAADGGPRALRRTWLAVAAIAVFAVGVTGAWLALDRWSPRARVPARYALTMPEGVVLAHGATESLMISADARGVVYEGRSVGNWQLYWHDLDGPGGWPLEGTEGARNPFLSPDGKWLAFWKDDRILKLPLEAGRVDEAVGPAEITRAETLRGATWGRDGTIVYSSRDRLWRVAASGGAPQLLTEPERSNDEGSHRWPRFLPDGRHVLFNVQSLSTRQDRARIAVLSLDTGRRLPILDGGVYPRYLPSGHLVFGLNNSLLAVAFDPSRLEATGTPTPVLSGVSIRGASNNAAYDVSDDGSIVYVVGEDELPANSLTWVTRDGRTEPVTSELKAYGPTPAVSPDGRRLAVEIDTGSDLSIAIYDVRDGAWTRFNAPGDCHTPVWSPTGDRLAFASNAGGAFNVYVADVDDEAPHALRVTRSTNDQWPSSWSPDGRYLAFEEDRRPSGGKTFETYIVPLDGSQPPQRWGPEATDVTMPSFSPDGRWLAYQSFESGKWEAYVRPLSGAAPARRVSAESGGFAPVWAASGREIFYLEGLQDTRVMVRPIESVTPWRLGPPAVAFALPAALGNPYYFGSRAYSVTPDGGRVLVVRQNRPRSTNRDTFQVIRHWAGEVTARMAR